MAENKEKTTEVKEKNVNVKAVGELAQKNACDKLQTDVAKELTEISKLKARFESKMAELSARKKTEEQVEIPSAPVEEPVIKQAKVEEVTEVSPEIKEVEPVKAEQEPKARKEKAEQVITTPENQPAPATPVQEEPVKAEETPKEQPVEAPKTEEKKLPSFIVRRATPVSQKPEERRTFVPKADKRADRPQGERKTFTPNSQVKFGDKPVKPSGQQPFKKNETYVAPQIAQPVKAGRNANNKNKQRGEKNFEEKRVLNKRSLIRNQVDIDDFDENKTGYRKMRPAKKNKEQEVATVKIERAVINTEIIPLKVLSEKIGITAAEITKRLFKEGIMKTINDSIDYDTAAFIAADLGIELELKLDKTAEDVLSEGFDTEADDVSKLVTRPPVVTVMGHVDHGKTSLLDRIRKTNVTAGEAGGITQHIGAYQVSVGGKAITFLDTPGHAAFTSMRARGAQATDVAILVVAADDGIMPQTIEAISHAKAADVPIIVAINKIDKPEANIDRIKTQLTEHGLLPEEWGGDTILCPVSAKTGAGMEELLESVNLVAEIKELKANPDRKAKGVVIEAKLDHAKGPIATILIQNGTLKISDSVVVGTVTGKIRAMMDDKGRRVSSAGPSMPVSIMGLDEVPNAGDILYAVEQEKLTKLVAEERRNKERENMMRAQQKVTLDDVFGKIAEGAMKGLNLIVKADVQGSVEAVKQSLEKLSNEEVRVNVIHAQAGAINESDIMLAESSHAIIIGFNVRPDSNAKQIAERSGVDVKLYRVIYEAIEDVEKALKGMLAPKFTEVYLGKAEVREVFKISGVGQVAGCYVTEGKIARNSKLRIYRDDVMICEGNVLQLKRFKDDVKEVSQGFECGISIEKFNDIKIGDFIESYQVEESKE